MFNNNQKFINFLVCSLLSMFFLGVAAGILMSIFLFSLAKYDLLTLAWVFVLFSTALAVLTQFSN